jgi:hypothetical protein
MNEDYTITQPRAIHHHEGEARAAQRPSSQLSLIAIPKQRSIVRSVITS